MKRKRAIESSEAPQESSKIKKHKSNNKNNSKSDTTDTALMDKNQDKNIQDSADPVLTKTRGKRGIKTSSQNKALVQSNLTEPPEPSTSSSAKPRRKRKGDINQNGEVTDDLGSRKNEKLGKRKKNGIQNRASSRASSDSPSDFQPLKNLIEQPFNIHDETQKEIVMDNSLSLVSKKKRPGRKAVSFVDPDIEGQEAGVLAKQGLLKNPNKKLQLSKVESTIMLATAESDQKKTKKKVRIDETESLKVKKERVEPHFSSKELPAKIIKSKSNKNLTEEVKVSPLTIQSSKKEKRGPKKIKLPIEDLVGEDQQEDEVKDVNCKPSGTSEESDLEVYYINKNAKTEAKKKTPRKSLDATLMPKEDQLILVQRMQHVIPENDTKSYKYRLQNLEWQNVAFKNYSLEDCQKVWTQLIKKVRHYRLLIEITHDVKKIIERNDLQELKPHNTKASNKKHPDMPKRPLSSYLLFYIRKRDKIGKERPDLDPAELNKYISEVYQNLPPEKRQKYELLSAKQREEYKIQLEEFYAKHPEMRKVVIKRERKMRKEHPPKKPTTPYKLFVQSELQREDIVEEDKAEFKEVCKEKWRQMPDSKKLGWINLAEEHHMKYEEELKEYMAKHPEYTPKSQPLKPFLSRQEMNLKEKLAGKPKKPPGTAYGLFISMTLHESETIDIPPRERWFYTSSKWKAMTDEERDQYKKLLLQMQEQYEKDFKVYLESLPEDKRQEELLKNLPKKRKNARRSVPTTKPTRSRKPKVENPVPPPRSVYKFFAEKYGGENPKEAWKKLTSEEKMKYEEELSTIKDKYIKEFEIYLQSLSKKELTAFCATRNSQAEDSSSDESDSESDNGDEESSDDSSNNSDSENDSDDN